MCLADSTLLCLLLHNKNTIMRLQNPSCILDNTRPAMSKTSLRFSKSEEAALSSLSRPYILENLLENKRSWFVIGGFRSILGVSVFQGSLLFFKSTVSFTFALSFFCLLYTETWQV